MLIGLIGFLDGYFTIVVLRLLDLARSKIAITFSVSRVQVSLNRYPNYQFGFCTRKNLAVFLKIVVEMAESGYHLWK
jgi:hypothetical protein